MTDGTPDISNGSLAGASGTVMTTNQMLELVAADALGLLDDDDRAAFDGAFAGAPAAVRELVWAEQARIAEMGLELPDVSPDPSLRASFLARVRAELERAQRVPVTGQSEATTRSVSHGAPASGPRSLGLRRARRVNSKWRIAAIGASVAMVALAVLQVQLRQDFDELQQRSEIAALIDGIGIEHVGDALFGDASTQRVQFTPVGVVGRAQAMLLRNPDRDTSRLYVMNLESRTAYTLVAVDEHNTPLGEVASFETDDLLTGVDIDLPGNPGETVRFAIMSTSGDPRVLFVAEFQLA